MGVLLPFISNYTDPKYVLWDFFLNCVIEEESCTPICDAGKSSLVC